MSKIFILNPDNKMLATSQGVLDSTVVSGVSINLTMLAFQMGPSGFTAAPMPSLNKEIKRIGSYNKKVSLGIKFGNFARNITGVRFCLLVEGPGQGTENLAGISVPVFYDTAYLDYVQRFIVFLKGELTKDPLVYDLIESIKVTGINQVTCEMRVPDQDFTGTGNEFDNAALKWRDLGYTTVVVKEAAADIILMFKSSFGDKTLLLPIIAGLNGFPCINDLGQICPKGKRPDLTRAIVNDITKPNGIMAGWCFLNSTSIPPDYISDTSCFYQTENRVPATRNDFMTTLTRGEVMNGKIIEVQDSIFKKYPI